MTLFALPVDDNGIVEKDAFDDAVNEAIEARFGQLVTGVLVVGEWDASSGNFPTARPDASAIQVGDSWVVSASGTVDSVAFGATDRIIALTAGGGATFAGNWAQVKTSALDAVPTTRNIAAGGLATGGGTLAADRTITVSAASQVQAEEGSATNVAMTPQRTKQAIDAQAPTQATGVWEAGTSEVESRISALKLKAAVEAHAPDPGAPHEDGPDATTSGTAHDFTAIPAGVNEIVIMLDLVSLSGTDNLYLQLGTGGTPQTSGYNGRATNFGASIAPTSAFGILTNTATQEVFMTILLNRVPGSNKWVMAHQGGTNAAAAAHLIGDGVVTLSGELDMVRLTRSGTDTFDGGTWSVRAR